MSFETDKLEWGEVINDNKDVFHPVMEQKFDDTVYYEAFAKATVEVVEFKRCEINGYSI